MVLRESLRAIHNFLYASLATTIRDPSIARTRIGEAGSINSPRVITSTIASPKRALPLGRRIESATPLAPTESFVGESTVLSENDGPRACIRARAITRNKGVSGRNLVTKGNGDAREKER